ncbi:MAG: zinc-binding dehydrogenase [Armatimonadota bacterium]|nr:zinc-binding dehydrogenase [bacterium]MDW8320795.1 zinc-binding dehydrogenase [Armatimonadota bacterium]
MHQMAVEYPQRGQVCLVDIGEPPPLQPTQILMRTHYTGVTNGTERHALLGEHGFTRYPSRHGYQHVGRVEAVGQAVKGFQPGDWVFYGQYVGHRGWNVVDVAFADVYSNSSHLCLRLPEGMDYRLCALFGVAGVAMRAVRRFRVKPAQKVWVAGVGVIGQFAAQAARAFGADVTVSDLQQHRLDVAKTCGSHRCINVGEQGVESLQDHAPYDCIIDCSGAPDLLKQVHEMHLLARGGVIGLVAVRSQTEFPWAMLHATEASIEVSCHFSLDDLRVLLHFVRQGIIRIEPVVSHVASIEQAPVLYEVLRDRPGDLLGVIFDWGCCSRNS